MLLQRPMALKVKKYGKKNLVFSLFHLMTSKYPCYAKSIYLHNCFFFQDLLPLRIFRNIISLMKDEIL
jgi:membrane protein CcdC involved in cytochrome C biogenesis